MALDRIISHLSDDERAMLDRLPAYDVPVPREGLVKLALDLPQPEALLDRLLAASLVERYEDPQWLALAYQTNVQVVHWLASQDGYRPRPRLAARCG